MTETSALRPLGFFSRRIRIVCLLLVVALAATGCVHGPLAGRIAAPPGVAPSGAVAYPLAGSPVALPDADPFYHPPAAIRLLSMAPGTLIRYRPVQPRAYRISHVQARAWQFVYRSSDAQGRPIADVATLLVPPHPIPRLVSYQVAYDALDRLCEPSQEILRGTMIEQWFVSKALARGWPVLLADHEGPNLDYLSGRNAGHAVLDAIRGARAFDPRLLGGPNLRVALWGYSGGAFASLWAGQMAKRYAPKLPIVAIAAGGAPANLGATARHVDGGGFAAVYFQAVIGLARSYPQIDLDRLLNARGQKMKKRLAKSCLGQELAGVRDPLLSGYSFHHLKDYTTVSDLLDVPAVKRIVKANRLGGHGLVAPLYYYEGWFDPFTPRDQARALAKRYCEQKTSVTFAWSIGGHLSTAVARADDAVAFIAARFAGKTPHNSCPSILARWSDQPTR